MGAELKVFINLCSHGEIGAPSVKKKLNAEGESVEGITSTSYLLQDIHNNQLAILYPYMWLKLEKLS